MKRPLAPLLLFALAFVVVLAITFGPVLSVEESIRGLFGASENPVHTTIVRFVRLPRVLVALVVGGALGATGAALQGLFRNPLSDPALLGVSGSAAFFSQLAIFLGLTSLTPVAMPLAAVAGALLATMILAAVLARIRGSSRDLLLLSGVALTQLGAAGSALVVSLAIADYSRSQRLMAWMLGSLDGRTWTHVGWGFVPLLVCVVILHRQGKALDSLSLGEVTASSLGVDVVKLERTVILCSAILSGLSVALAGLVGFVGLVVPHLVRKLRGASHRTLIVDSALLGAVVLVTCDALSRRVLAPSELPVGVMTSALGAPWFAFLLGRRLWRAR